MLISLTALAMLVAAPVVRSEPISPIPATILKESSNQPEPDVDAMIEKSIKFHSQGNYAAAADIWRRLVGIAEKVYGPDHLYVATSLNNLAWLLIEQRQYFEAEPLYRRALIIREKALGQDHPDVSVSLNNLAGLLSDQGQYGAAEPLHRRSLAIREKVLGPEHPDVATSLNNLAGLLSDQGQYGAAEPLYRRSLAILVKTLGPEHPNLATSLNNLAELLNNQGQYIEAEPLYRRSLAIREKALGPDHPDIAISLNNLAHLLNEQGQYAAAESLYQRSLAIIQNALGPDHPNVATILGNLAGLLSDQGQYDKAEILFLRSLAIQEKAFGPDHPDIAISLGNLAELFNTKRQYSAAEPLYQRSLAIHQKALGLNHPYVAISLANLANLMMRQGLYAKVEPLIRRSLAIREKALGPDHPDVASSLANLSDFLSHQGQYAEAEALIRRSLAIREKAFGPDHLDIAFSLNNLALLLKEQGQNAAAEPLYQRSLAIHEKALGPDHPHTAISLNNLAVFLGDQGKYSEAEILARRSLEIREKSFGVDHYNVTTSLYSLAWLLYEQKLYNKATLFLYRSSQNEANWLLRELPLLPDQARTDQLRELGSGWEYTFGVIAAYPPAASLALETRLNRQGLLPEIEQRQALLLNAPGVDRDKVEQLQALTQRLASVSLPVDQRVSVREQRDKLQVELYRQIPDLQIQLVTAVEVAQALPADGALVEFQRYRPYDGRKPKPQRWGEARYIALVLKPSGQITSVPLGSAAAIDALVHKGLSSSAQDQSDAEVSWGELGKLVLKPLLPQLRGSRQWFFSPDSELNRVPFAALPSPQQPDKPLAQSVQLRLLTTGRELLRLQQSVPAGSAAVVMANPSYDRAGAKTAPPAKAVAAATVAQRRSTELGSSQWRQLPASEREGQQVASLLGTRLISGAAATTTALQRQQRPRVLHVATHGFFLADQDNQPAAPLRAIQEESHLLQSLRQEDPQLRSGLVFAGANQPALDPNDDGHLTAAEALALNLKGTELVVLSACSTGQGEVRTGEGVYGLQRSLTVAGARSTLLSLWKVDDTATAEFMVRFYLRLKAGEGRADALAAVQAEFRGGVVKGPKGEDWSTPYHWAAWQLTGDWGSIPGL
jgi:CHAT domain-containing protein/tetratricopeptide (TPR) repeat protein